MSAFYDRMRATATRLLTRFDQVGSSHLVRVLTPGPTPLDPPVESEQSVSFMAVVRGVSESIVSSDPNISATDLQVITDTAMYSPSIGDMVDINGTSRVVLRVDPIPASGDPCAYRFYVR